jgi:hypothetical protein
MSKWQFANGNSQNQYLTKARQSPDLILFRSYPRQSAFHPALSFSPCLRASVVNLFFAVT